MPPYYMTGQTSQTLLIPSQKFFANFWTENKKLSKVQICIQVFGTTLFTFVICISVLEEIIGFESVFMLFA